MKSEIKNKGNTEEKSKGGFKERREKCLAKLNTVPTVNIKGNNIQQWLNVIVFY